LKQVWNLRGTSLELLGLIVRVLCDILELRWNLRGTLGGFMKLERWKKVNMKSKNQLIGLFFFKKRKLVSLKKISL
jgi:hypothetical protein